MITTNLSALAAIWKDDPDHTRIGFEVKHAGLSFVSGYFSDFDISVRQANDDYKNTHILAEVQTTSISTGVVARDNHLRSPDFFNVEVFPLMTFLNTLLQKQMFIGAMVVVNIVQCQKTTMKADSICERVIVDFVLISSLIVR